MKIKDLKPDSRNANRGTARGQKMIVNSVQNNKLGRSIVVDKNNRIIGGNKTVEAVAEILGVDAEVQVIETNGEQLIVHKRNDLDLADPDPNNPARKLAYQDNLTGYFSFDLDPVNVMADIEAGFNFEAIDIQLPDLEGLMDGAFFNSRMPPDEFPEFDENIDTEHCCPKCGYEWSGKPG